MAQTESMNISRVVTATVRLVIYIGIMPQVSRPNLGRNARNTSEGIGLIDSGNVFEARKKEGSQRRLC